MSVDEDVVSLDIKITQYNFPTALQVFRVRAMVAEADTSRSVERCWISIAC